MGVFYVWGVLCGDLWRVEDKSTLHQPRAMQADTLVPGDESHDVMMMLMTIRMMMMMMMMARLAGIQKYP